MHPQWLSIMTASVAWVLAFLSWSRLHAVSLFLVGTFAMLQHLTEALQGAGPIVRIHDIDPNFFCLLDRFIAFSTLIVSIPQIVTPIPTFSHVVIAMGAASLLMMCDAGFFQNAWTYSMVHSLWHLEIYAFVYLRLEASNPKRCDGSHIGTEQKYGSVDSDCSK